MVFGLMAAGFAAPILDLYGKNPSVFVANRTGRWQIVAFALLVTFFLPLVALVLLAITEKIGGRVADLTYYSLVAVSAAATGLAISRQTVPDNTAGATALALGVAVAIFLIVMKVESGMLFFALLGPAVLVMFLAISPTSRLLAAEKPVEETSSIVGNAVPVVLIQLDEMPLASLMTEEGGVNAALFPNFARLAGEGTWYRNAFSNSIATTESVPSILSSRLGDVDDSPSLASYPDNLFTLLGAEYQMHVVEWLTDMCPEAICKDYAGRGPARFGSLIQDVGVVYGHLSLPRSLRERLPTIDGSWKGFLGQAESRPSAPVDVSGLPIPGPGQRSRWIDWMERVIDGIAPDQPPTLHFVHVEAPHIPWRINPSGAHYQRPEQYDEVDGVESGGHWVDRPGLPRLGFQRHLLQLGFVDHMLGRFFGRLDEAGSWDDALVIVLADHGASFVPGAHRRWPMDGNLDDLYRIPLFVKYPGQAAGATIDDPAYAIDVLPTIVDVLDVATDWDFAGQSLLTIEGTNRPHQVVRWCCDDDPVSTDLDILFEQVRRNHEWVPDQSDWVSVAGAGPYALEVGKPVTELAPTTDDRLRWSLTNQEALDDVDRSTGFVPTFISGRLELPEGIAGDDLLIAVDGVVAGTGLVTRDDATSGEIHGIIAEDLVEEGANEVSILVPAAAGGGWITGTAANLSLELRAEDGHVIALEPEGNKRVEIKGVKPTGSGWEITGWAADVSKKLTPDRVYVFAGDVLIAAGPPNLDNDDVVRWFKSDKLLRSGFSFEIPASELPEGLERLTVIAEFGGEAVDSPASLPAQP